MFSIDLRERVFGKLQVMRTETDVGISPVIWMCFCTHCGTFVLANEADLVLGNVASCEGLERPRQLVEGSGV